MKRGDAIQKYEFTEPVSTLLNEFDGNTNLRAIAIGQDDSLFIAQLDNNSWIVTERNPGGLIVKRFGYGEIDFGMSSIAVAAGGEVFGSEEYVGTPFPGNRVISIDRPPSGPLSCCLDVQTGNTKATLKGQVNPEGKATTYHFDYVTEESFEDEGGFASPKTVSTSESASIGEDFSLHPASASIGCATPTDPPQPECLLPATDYRYRLVAINADGGSEVEGQFTTKDPFEILATFATGVDTGSATLNTTVNPLGIPASGYFEYVTEAQFQANEFDEATKAPNVDASEAPLDFGAGEAPVAKVVTLPGLAPNTTYRYRIVVSDSFVDEKFGPTQSFTTFPARSNPTNSCANVASRIGPGAHLPDCRAYEMVSPVNKNGGDIKVLNSTLNYAARLEQSSADGSRFAFSSVTAFADAVSAPWTSEYLANRIDGVGWFTQAISPPRESNSLTFTPAFKWDIQYKTFSPDLGSGWLIHDTNPPLDECAPADTLNLYRRDNTTGSYEALTTTFPTNVASGGYELELQGVSADEAHAVFRANGKLTSKASTSTLSQVYMHVKDPEGGCGELKLVSVLPNGSATATDSSLATFKGLPGESRGNAVANALSADGSRAFWSTAGNVALYLREMEIGKTVLIATGGEYQAANPSGSKALYAIDEKLFEVDAAKALAGQPGASTPIADKFKGIAATTADLSRIYFVSTEALGGEGVAKEPNLYLREGGATKLVTTLYGGDATLPGGDIGGGFNYQGFLVGSSNSNANGVRASADGSHLAFVSAGSPTGYDNTDAADPQGRKALEVYLYDAGTGKLACISCNPSGARPQGREFKSFGSPLIRRVAARLPAGQNQFFTPRALSADGNHLFFDSFDALVPSDRNKMGDVYEWTRASGQEECEAQGAELFVPKAGGCLSLISSGQDEVDSELADMTPDGHDVFIRTGSSLLPQDPGQIDVYDARIGGGLPIPPPLGEDCETPANSKLCPNPAPVGPNDPSPSSAASKPVEQFKQKECPKGKVLKGNKCVKKCPKGKVLKGKKCVKKNKGKNANKNKKANANRRAGR